jgi:hypothetical protein
LTWYNDSNQCETPTDYIENSTKSCDFNHDRIYGIADDFNSKLSDSLNDTILIVINETSNLSSQNFSNSTQLVEIKGESRTYVEFIWNFSKKPLDLNQIDVKKGIFNNRSYMLMKNILTNKTVYFKPLNDSGEVCIRNSDINSISAISTYCNRADRGEILLSCPGSEDDITCEIESSTYKIKGLTNSGIIEYIEDDIQCIPSWNCTSFENAPCINNVKTINCKDKNYCFDNSTRPALTQSCTSGPSCQTSWDCTEWNSCEDKKQTRACTDSNNCGTSTGRPAESKNCESAMLTLPTYIYYGLIAILVIAIIIVLIMIILKLFSHGSKREKSICTN